jgi:hypothetical protein
VADLTIAFGRAVTATVGRAVTAESSSRSERSPGRQRGLFAFKGSGLDTVFFRRAHLAMQPGLVRIPPKARSVPAVVRGPSSFAATTLFRRTLACRPRAPLIPRRYERASAGLQSFWSFLRRIVRSLKTGSRGEHP